MPTVITARAVTASKAYGILSGGPARTGDCNMSDPNEYSVYTSLSEDLNEASSQTGITMNLNTA
jgi:hypothetical protein